MTEISQDMALATLEIGLKKADELAEPSCVAIVDAGGNLLAFARSTDAAFGVGDIAINKAYTSAALKCSTRDLYSDAQPGGEIYGLETAGGARPYVLFGGGEPIFADNRIVGAVGVSGGPVSADLVIAAAMSAYLKSQL